MTTRRLLRGGLVADGIGRHVVRADVLIQDADIAAVGPDIGGGVDAEIIDLPAGSVVCPGFIDAHVHAEGLLIADGVVPAALAQGVTTLVVGQDGSSWIGASPATAAYLSSYFGPVNGPAPDGGCTVASFTTAVTGRLAHNVAVLASQGTIRHNIAGAADRPLDAAEVRAAGAEVERSLADGAVGLSSGLDYVPSRFGSPAEITEFARPLADANRPYVSHLRAYGPNVGDGLAELVGVGADAGVAVHASHLWGHPADLATAFADAAARGVALTFDMYPYIWSSTILAMLVLPPAVLAGGVQATLDRLADPAIRADLLDTDKLSDESLSRILLGYLPDTDAHLAGRTIADAAAADQQPPGPWTLDLLIHAKLQVGAHLDRPELTDADLAWIVTHDRHCAGSDGIYRGQHPHPRGFGALARLAGYYTNHDGQPDYQQLVRHLSTNPADAHRLTRRGRIKPGNAADICVLAPTGLIDHATFDHPCAPPTGVTHVLVSGIQVWAHGAPLTGARPGKVIGE